MSHLLRLYVSLFSLTLALAALNGCGGSEKKVDTDQIRKNADEADRDLDRESTKEQE